MHQLAFIPNIGWQELLIILAIGLLIFGRRLPEVGKSLAKGIVEFRRGIKDIEEELDDATYRSGSTSSSSGSPAKPPLTEGGTDPRVSRADVPEEVERTPNRVTGQEGTAGH